MPTPERSIREWEREALASLVRSQRRRMTGDLTRRTRLREAVARELRRIRGRS